MEEPIRTLPAWTYRTPEFFEAERREVFRKQWVMVGHVSAAPGSPATTCRRRVAGEPIVVVRGKDGELRGVLERLPAPRRARRSTAPATAARRCAARTTAGHTASTASCWACPRSPGSPGSTSDANGLWPLQLSASLRGSCSRTSIPIPSRCSDVLGPVRGVACALSAGAARALRLGADRASHQLEELDRQLPRGLPHPGRPPGPAAAARLQAATWSRPPTRTSRSPAARCATRRRKNRQERLYQRLVRPMPGLREPEAEQWNFIFAFPARRSTSTLTRSTSGSTIRSTSGARSRSGTRSGRPRRSGRRDRLVRRLNVPHQPPRAARGQRAHRARAGGARVEPLPGRRDRARARTASSTSTTWSARRSRPRPSTTSPRARATLRQ